MHGLQSWKVESESLDVSSFQINSCKNMSGGFLRTIFNGLRQGLNKIVREKAIMVGEDHLGNKYYEVIAGTRVDILA